MIRILQSLLALISLLLLACMAAKANSATWQETDPACKMFPPNRWPLRRPRPLPAHHRLVPGAAAGDPFSRPAVCLWILSAPRLQPTAAFHRSYERRLVPVELSPRGLVCFPA